MDTRTKIEVALGLAIVLLLAAVGAEEFQKRVGVAASETIAKHDAERDAQVDARMKEFASRDEARQKDYEAKSLAVTKSTPQQLVVKLPEYVPQATAPVQVLPANSPIVQSGAAKAGDALVPAADIKPIAQALLDGNKCAGDLGSCKQTAQAWEEKYKIKSDEAEQWRTAAKGGSVWKRVRGSAKHIAIGVAVGAAVLCGTGHCK